ncbi:putative cytochrome b-domain protein [Trypanosoma theileri]|uniref:Putative cytochrome b-domain protein n=1 Tax=Trypanosoma theileri TaxID=67003 RepID=A0A1X0NJR3_9TRYP|nr:putative cytochrome b-domain protein [Trypanosoma theileri]ORC85014.1 putative cytochrome b-domain protein [Trypanosoma theileri]
MTSTKVYTADEVAKHTTVADGWIIIDGDVLNVSSFLDDHPGGRDVLTALLGTDASQAFADVNHSKSARRLFSSLQVGKIAGSRQMRLADVKAKQATATDKNSCWVVIANKVYDLSPFLDMHPGGRDVLLCNAGTDASQAFADVNHSKSAHRMMEKYYVADLHPEDRVVVRNAQSKSNDKSLNEKESKHDNPQDAVNQFIMAQMKMGAIVLGMVALMIYALMQL